MKPTLRLGALPLLCLPLAMAAYVPEEALIVDAEYYVGPYDSESPRCEVKKFDNASSASLQHHFGAGGGGGGWGWTGLMLLLNPKDGELDLTQPTKLTLDVLKFASGVLHVEALRAPPPDSLSITSTGTMHRTRKQLYCPPALCVPPKPSASVDGVSASWCGWSEWDSTAIAPTLVEHKGAVDVDISALFANGDVSMLKVWAAPTCGDGFPQDPCYMWDAQLEVASFALSNF